MHLLDWTETPGRISHAGRATLHYVGVALTPWRIVDLRDDVAKNLALIPTEEERHRVEDVAENPQMGEQLDTAELGVEFSLLQVLVQIDDDSGSNLDRRIEAITIDYSAGN